MVFSSIIFLFTFLPVTLVLYFITPFRRVRNIVLLLASLVFYAWGDPVYIFLIIFSIIFNYFMGRDIDFNKEDPKAKKRSLIFAVIVNLFVLGFFKYYGFVIESLNAVLPFDIPYKSLGLPIGISFYTFQTVAYIIDVYRGTVSVQKDIINFGLFVSMFPRVTQGPIVRYADVEPQLTERRESLNLFGNGMMYFVRGLAKKVLLANNIGILYTTVSGMDIGEFSAVTAWLGAIAYTFQIYFDFSGYSDMAIGLGRMFGFNFMKNFDYPYISKSVTEFWRRWHISLGTWFREYVYIPLGGNRVSVPKHIRNILVVWFLTGLWHGASWNFVLWGLYFFVFIAAERLFLGRILERIPVIFSHLYLLIVVFFGWAIFRFRQPVLLNAVLGGMFGANGNPLTNFEFNTVFLNYVFFLIAAVIATTPLLKALGERFSSGGLRTAYAYNTLQMFVPPLLLLLSTAALVGNSYNPFLYFQF